MECGIERSYLWVTSVLAKKYFCNLKTAFNNREILTFVWSHFWMRCIMRCMGIDFNSCLLCHIFIENSWSKKTMDMKQLMSSEDNKDESEEALFEGGECYGLISAIYLTFKRETISTCTSFCILGEHLASPIQINELVDHFKEKQLSIIS